MDNKPIPLTARDLETIEKADRLGHTPLADYLPLYQIVDGKLVERPIVYTTPLQGHDLQRDTTEGAYLELLKESDPLQAANLRAFHDCKLVPAVALPIELEARYRAEIDAHNERVDKIAEEIDPKIDNLKIEGRNATSEAHAALVSQRIRLSEAREAAVTACSPFGIVFMDDTTEANIIKVEPMSRAEAAAALPAPPTGEVGVAKGAAKVVSLVFGAMTGAVLGVSLGLAVGILEADHLAKNPLTLGAAMLVGIPIAHYVGLSVEYLMRSVAEASFSKLHPSYRTTSIASAAMITLALLIVYVAVEKEGLMKVASLDGRVLGNLAYAMAATIVAPYLTARGLLGHFAGRDAAVDQRIDAHIATERRKAEEALRKDPQVHAALAATGLFRVRQKDVAIAEKALEWALEPWTEQSERLEKRRRQRIEGLTPEMESRIQQAKDQATGAQTEYDLLRGHRTVGAVSRAR